jgi:threonine synthase
LYAHLTIECLDCGYKDQYSVTATSCPHCGSQWREATYPYDSIGKSLLTRLASRSFDLWRYRELLPINEPNPMISMGEGGTPLIHAVNLGMMLGCPHIYIKDERQGPTASFKDRQAAVSITALKEAGISEVVLASTGNVAIAYSAYAVRAGIKLWAFLTSMVPAEKMREVALYGTQVIKVTGSYDQAKQVAAEFARQRDLFLERGSRSISSVESMKTIAFEIAEQVTALLGPAAPNHRQEMLVPWRVPDWYFQSVSGGLGPLGVQKGFIELYKAGLTGRVPSIACIQAEGCSPMTQAWKNKNPKATVVQSPHTHIATLATGDPGRTYTLLHERMSNYGGTFESISDEDTFRMIHILAKMDGISVEPAAAVAFSGLVKLVRNGQVKPTDVVVINCTGHTMAIEGNILGESWYRDLDLTNQLSEVQPEEGLLAALSRLNIERYTRVAIVDDNADARRLIRRILQAQGNYEIIEISNGQEAIDHSLMEPPDLMILDLMMPELDGFSVLDALQASPQTASIPVIVVTAKELTSQEKDNLRGRIHSLMQKGQFLNDDLLEEVHTTIQFSG